MARERYADHALRKLIEADAALTAADLTMLSGVTASADEINYSDTSAVGTVTASKVLTADANQMISGVLRRLTAVATGTATLTIAHSGSIYTNTGATAAVTCALPAATVGQEFTFIVTAAYELRIDPAGSETIGLPSSGVQQAAGKYITADAAGEYVHIICAKAGQWETTFYRGTWSVEG
jgi:hypothetical protein